MALFKLFFVLLFCCGLSFDNLNMDTIQVKKSSSNISFAGGDRVAWYHLIYPRGIYISSQNKTYITYHCEPGQYDRCVAVYDHSAKRWSEPVKVLTNPDSDKSNSHGVPAIIDDINGNIHLISGPQAGVYTNYKNDTVGNILSWTLQGSIGTGQTYPQLFRFSDASLHLLTRQLGSNIDFIEWASTDNGVTWTGPTTVYDCASGPGGGFIYNRCTKGSDDRIHCVAQMSSDDFYTHPREDLFYLVRSSDGTWRDIAGNAKTLPLRTADMAAIKIYDTGGLGTDIERPMIDSSGYPYILWVEGNSCNGEDCGLADIGTWYITRWNGSTWLTTQVVSGTQRVYGTLDIDTDNTLHAYIVTTSHNRMIHYKSIDLGATWTNAGTIWNNGTLRTLYTPVVIDNHHADAKIAWFAYGSAVNNQAYLYLWGDSGFIAADGSFTNP